MIGCFDNSVPIIIFSDFSWTSFRTRKFVYDKREDKRRQISNLSPPDVNFSVILLGQLQDGLVKEMCNSTEKHQSDKGSQPNTFLLGKNWMLDYLVTQFRGKLEQTKLQYTYDFQFQSGHPNLDFKCLIVTSDTCDVTYFHVVTTLGWNTMFNVSMLAAKPKLNVTSAMWHLKVRNCCVSYWGLNFSMYVAKTT